MYEFETIFLLALLFLIVYFVGSYRNRKIGVNYAKAIKENLASHSEFVGFRPYGRGGFRTLCRMKEDEAFTRIEMAVSLVDRENLMHYPISLLTGDRDRLVCWGFLKGVVPSNIEVLPRSDKKLGKKLASQTELEEIKLENRELMESFTFWTSNPNFAKKFFSGSNVQKCLLEAGSFVNRLSLSQRESRLYLSGDLRRDSLKPLLNLLIRCAERYAKCNKTMV